MKAGGVGMILVNGMSNGEGLVSDAHLIPACAVGAKEGDILKAYASSSSTSAHQTATIVFCGTVVGVKTKPVVASFSSRGPNGINPEILKPDLTALGVNILASWTEAVGPTGLDSDTQKNEFNILFRYLHRLSTCKRHRCFAKIGPPGLEPCGHPVCNDDYSSHS